MERPAQAFAFGASGFLAVLVTAWSISGEPLDRIWSVQLYLPLVLGIVFAGIAERNNPSRWHVYLRLCAIAILLSVAIWTSAFTLPILLRAFANGPVVTAVAGIAGTIWLYHMLLGALSLATSVAMRAAHRFIRHRERQTIF